MAAVWNEIVNGNYIGGYLTDSLISLLMILCFFDVMLGILTAIRKGTINSTIGLNGIIRKVVIIVSLLFLHMIDILCGVNLISFFPNNIKDWIQSTLQINTVGIAGLFGVYIILFELLSILKNWESATNIRIPQKIKKLLNRISSEVQTDEDGDKTSLEDLENQFKVENNDEDEKNEEENDTNPIDTIENIDKHLEKSVNNDALNTPIRFLLEDKGDNHEKD